MSKSVPASHLILVDKASCIRYNHYEKFEFCAHMLPSLRKMLSPFVEWLTFRPLSIYLRIVNDLDHEHIVSERIKRLFPTRAAAVQEDGARAYFCWDISFDCPYLDVPTESSTKKWWINEDTVWKLLDSRGLLWPYPREQLDWLLWSLGNLEEGVLEAVKYLDGKWMDRNFGRPRAILAKLNVTSEAISDDRRLDSLDCAFLGRLLVSLDQKEKIHGQEPPPSAFRHDLRARVVFRPAQQKRKLSSP